MGVNIFLVPRRYEGCSFGLNGFSVAFFLDFFFLIRRFFFIISKVIKMFAQKKIGFQSYVMCSNWSLCTVVCFFFI